MPTLPQRIVLAGHAMHRVVLTGEVFFFVPTVALLVAEMPLAVIPVVVGYFFRPTAPRTLNHDRAPFPLWIVFTGVVSGFPRPIAIMIAKIEFGFVKFSGAFLLCLTTPVAHNQNAGEAPVVRPCMVDFHRLGGVEIATAACRTLCIATLIVEQPLLNHAG